MLAAAAGSGSMSAEHPLGRLRPIRLARILRICFHSTGGHVVAQRRQPRLQVRGLIRVQAGNSIVESTCPAFIAAPRMTAS